MSSPLRLAYRAILQLHPLSFRAEFGEEMLWIFDEESRHGHAIHVLLDGLRSLCVQNLRPQQPQVEAAGNLYVELDSSLPSERFAQTILTVMFFSLCLTLFLSMVVPSVSKPLNRVLFRPIGFFAQTAMPQPQRSTSARLGWPQRTNQIVR